MAAVCDRDHEGQECRDIINRAISKIDGAGNQNRSVLLSEGEARHLSTYVDRLEVALSGTRWKR